MSKHGTIRRYTLIIEKLRSNQYPSFEEIKRHLFNVGFEISARTIQRDIEQIRFEFGIEIIYDRFKNGYFIDYEKSINIDSFFKFLEIVNTAELLTESLSESKETLNYILFENQGNLKGLEHLKPLLQAIKEKRIITFTHYNFSTEKTKHFTIEPYLLREYQDRWYIVGIDKKLKSDRVFGIDRISELKITDKIFKPNKNIDIINLFENIIGVRYSDEKAEKVVLSFTHTQGKYVKSLPLHKSQKILIDNENELRIELEIIPNYEFMQKIFMHNANVIVLEPKWLVKEIKEKLKQTLDKYKN
jgi:predicted DNA-binding transcriptional regulator YafY